MLHVNISKMENAIGLGYLVGAISVGLVTLLANFFSYRENNDILDAASEIKQATDAWPRQMRLFTTPEGKGYKFSLKTRGVLELAWQEHAFGSIGHGAPTADLTPQSIDAIKQRCTTQVPYAPFITELGNANTGENFLPISYGKMTFLSPLGQATPGSSRLINRRITPSSWISRSFHQRAFHC